MRKFKSFSVVLEVLSVVDAESGDHKDRTVLRNPSNGQVLDVCRSFDELPLVMSDLMDAVPLQSPVAELKASAAAARGDLGTS